MDIQEIIVKLDAFRFKHYEPNHAEYQELKELRNALEKIDKPIKYIKTVNGLVPEEK